MADPPKGPGKTPSYTLPFAAHRRATYGVYYDKYFRGKHHIQSWPRPRGKRGSPGQLIAQELFRRAALMIGDMTDTDKLICRRLAHGSLYVWRDIAMLAMTGRLYIIPGITDVPLQNELYALSDIVGSIIYLAPTGWVALDPGNPNDVLTIQGTPPVPTWKPPTGGGPTIYTAQPTADETWNPTPIAYTPITDMSITLPASTTPRRALVTYTTQYYPSHVHDLARLDGVLITPGAGVPKDSDGRAGHTIGPYLIDIPGDGATHTIDVVISAQGSTALTTLIHATTQLLVQDGV